MQTVVRRSIVWRIIRAAARRLPDAKVPANTPLVKLGQGDFTREIGKENA